MRITSSSFIGDMTNDYYLKQLKPTCEMKLNKVLAKKPRPIKCLKIFSNNPINRKYTQGEIKFVNLSNSE